MTAIILVLLAIALLTAAATLSYRGLVGVRARRRAAWEVEREEWRQWISRP